MFCRQDQRFNWSPSNNISDYEASLLETYEEETTDHTTNRELLFNSYLTPHFIEWESNWNSQSNLIYLHSPKNKEKKSSAFTAFTTQRMNESILNKEKITKHIENIQPIRASLTVARKNSAKKGKLKIMAQEEILIGGDISNDIKIGYWKRSYYQWTNQFDNAMNNNPRVSYRGTGKIGFTKKKLIPTTMENISVWTTTTNTSLDKITALTSSIPGIQGVNIENKKSVARGKEMIINLNTTISNIRIGLIDNNTLRKAAQEYLHSIKGNLRVYCRVKPISESSDTFVTFPEMNCNQLTTIALKPRDKIPNNSHALTYHFDRIFPQNTPQSEVFLEIKHFIQSALDGDNVCIFAYGATGSGKTYTMQGNNPTQPGGKDQNNILVNDTSGILPRCAKYIIEEKVRLNKINQSIELSLAALEIYNENVYDLLSTGPRASGNPHRHTLTIYCANNEVNIPNLQWKTIESQDDIIKYTNIASECRKSDSTWFNSESSRSHALYQIKISNNTNKKQSMINIIDWAGSERSQLTGKTQKNENTRKLQNEANYINKSWTALGRIINWIRDKKNLNKISIPYRESKLTMILQNYLKYNSKTAMIVNIAADIKNYNYTKESLMFASNVMMSC